MIREANRARSASPSIAAATADAVRSSGSGVNRRRRETGPDAGNQNGHMLVEAVQEVIERELALVTPTVRQDPSQVSAILEPDYREIGASGRLMRSSRRWRTRDRKGTSTSWRARWSVPHSHPI